MSTEEAGFDLRSLIRVTAEGSTSPDPAVITRDVMQKIDDEDRDVALYQALRMSVQLVMAASRHSINPGHHRRAVNPWVGGGQGPISHKVAQIRDHWKKVLRDPINLGPHEWKFLKDCTSGDLKYAADVRDKKAVENALRAQQYRDLEKVVIYHKAATVGELPEDVLRETLGGFSE